MSTSLNDDRTGDRNENDASDTARETNARARDDSASGGGLLAPSSAEVTPDSDDLIDIWIDDDPGGTFVEQTRGHEEGPPETTLGEGLDLGPEDELICTLLSMGWTQSQTANEVGCSAKKVQRRMSDPAFAGEVRRRGRADVAATTAKLFQLGQAATEVLSCLLSSEDERVRHQSARTVLEFGHRRYRVDVMESELSDRVATLEAIVDEIDEGHEGGRR